MWHTDNKGLQWLQNTRGSDPRGRYARWLEETEEFTSPSGCDKFPCGCVVQHTQAHSVRDGQFTRQEFQAYQQADPVLGVVFYALKMRGPNIPPRDNELRQWQKTP